MTVIWREKLGCWLRGTHRYEITNTDRWPAGHTVRLCRTCGGEKRFRP